MALVPARPQPMVAGGRVLGEDGRGRAVTGPLPFLLNPGTSDACKIETPGGN